MRLGDGSLRDNGLGNWMLVIPALAGAGVVVVLIYAAELPSSVRWSSFGTALAIAAAAGLVGGLVGFLFGIPRTVQGASASTSGPQFDANTNLEQVSDWLTKILVGVGLVQIGRALPGLTRLAESMKEPLGGQASSSAFGLALVISYASLGFLFLYLWSRERLPQELQMSTTVRKELDSRESARSNALDLVNRQLNSLKGGSAPTQDELNKVIATASDSTRILIFNEAEEVRSDNWKDPQTKPVMALTIPVFSALIAADSADQHYRNHGSLGWALKDQVVPDWSAAKDELTKAITTRDKVGALGWKLYESNRALCAIHLYAALAPGDAGAAALATSINQDIQAASTDQYAKQMLQSDPDIQQWIAHPPA